MDQMMESVQQGLVVLMRVEINAGRLVRWDKAHKGTRADAGNQCAEGERTK
jgi:hypothetical protein